MNQKKKYFCFSNRLFLQKRQIEVFAELGLDGRYSLFPYFDSRKYNSNNGEKTREERIFDQRNVR